MAAALQPKRVIGEAVAIEADVFTDGHELLAVETLWRAADEDELAPRGDAAFGQRSMAGGDLA